MHCFGAVMFMDSWGMFWALMILYFSWWISPVTPGRNLLSEGLERGHKESRRNVLLEWPGSLGLWPGSGTRVWLLSLNIICKMCVKNLQRPIIMIIICECSKLAQKEYKARHDWKMCKKFKFNHTNKWYMHNPAPVQEMTHINSHDTLTYTRITYSRQEDQTL